MLTKHCRYVVIVTTQSDTPILSTTYRELATAEAEAAATRLRWSPDYKVTLLIIH